jgi:hypothetical protein
MLSDNFAYILSWTLIFLLGIVDFMEHNRTCSRMAMEKQALLVTPNTPDVPVSYIKPVKPTKAIITVTGKK